MFFDIIKKKVEDKNGTNCILQNDTNTTYLQYFPKRYHYKVALMHVRMGQREACG